MNCLKRFGDPVKNEAKHMGMFKLHDNPRLKAVPKKVYCNHILIPALRKAMANIAAKGIEAQVISWDGCFNIRNKRSGSSASLHSWGMAVDINAASNAYGEPPTMSEELVECFTDAGFEWGGVWKKPDGMHFQLA